MTTRQAGTIVGFAVIGWALCGAIIGVGRAVTTLETTLILHAIGAPIIFAVLSWVYFGRFGFTTPIQTAIAFTGIVVLLDTFVVALFVERSFDMFGSVLGAWLPFGLIFASTDLTGTFVTTHKVRLVPPAGSLR